MIALFVLHMFILEQHLYLFIEIQMNDIDTYRKNFCKHLSYLYYIYSICSVALINYFLKHLLQHYKYKYIIFIEDDTEEIIM